MGPPPPRICRLARQMARLGREQLATARVEAIERARGARWQRDRWRRIARPLPYRATWGGARLVVWCTRPLSARSTRAGSARARERRGALWPDDAIGWPTWCSAARPARAPCRCARQRRAWLQRLMGQRPSGWPGGACRLCYSAMAVSVLVRRKASQRRALGASMRGEGGAWGAKLGLSEAVICR